MYNVEIFLIQVANLVQKGAHFLNISASKATFYTIMTVCRVLPSFNRSNDHYRHANNQQLMWTMCCCLF